MVEIRIGSAPPHHGPHSRPMNKYEFIAFIIMLSIFIIIVIIAILNQPKTQPTPEPADLPHSGHVMEVKGKSAPAVDIVGTQKSPSPTPAEPTSATQTKAETPSPAHETQTHVQASTPVKSADKPIVTQETTSQVPAQTAQAQSGDIIPDVKALAANASEGNPLPIEEVNNASKESFYGHFMHMR